LRFAPGDAFGRRKAFDWQAYAIGAKRSARKNKQGNGKLLFHMA
jgi:hypothetical protein